MTLEEALGRIRKPDEKAMREAQRRWDNIAKPLHSLGKLEDYLIRIAGMTGSSDICLDKKALVTMCADNGVVEEGVTQSGQEVTAIVTNNYATGTSSACVCCKAVGADAFAVDIGVAVDTTAINRKIAYGTKNMTKEPAMTREQAVRALEVGIGMAAELKDRGYRILATGEMGIGNTTTSSALASVFLNRDPAEVTGRGAGLTSAALKRKVDAIRRAIERNRPDPADGIDTLSKVGGLDIAGMAGVFLGGAALGMPVVIDGFISSAAALTAAVICPEAKSYMLASHTSKEPGAKLLLDALGMEGALNCGMCLGEGTGAVALFPLLDLACAYYRTMSTFTDYKIDNYEELT